MAIKLENVGIAVRDLEETISFFTDLGLTVMGRDTISGELTAGRYVARGSSRVTPSSASTRISCRMPVTK